MNPAEMRYMRSEEAKITAMSIVQYINKFIFVENFDNLKISIA